MENKVVFKRYSIIFLLIAISFGIILTLVNIKEYQFYKRQVNYKIASVIEKVKDKYPEISDREILEILNSEEYDGELLRSFGYDINRDVYLESMANSGFMFIFLETILFILAVLIFVLVIIIYKYKRDKELKNVINIIEKINRKNYELEIQEYTEDEISILKSEIYKTTVMLKEAADNSLEDKINLKNSLSDISHQLKTPLTSILIMLENIIDDEEMDPSVRTGFIKDIKREIIKINFLVQSILKLSKFESNTVNFLLEEVPVKEIVNNSIKNVSSLCDLKNISINIEGNLEYVIKCDKVWQIEAITNILKNAVEHSKENSKISIRVNKNNVYKEIIIEDFGTGMKDEDTEHIFERFYKSKISNKDSIGIGLELSKRIIEASNGRIYVKSSLGKGTTFTIKYFN